MNGTLEEKRVAVARDALAQVQFGIIEAGRGLYFFKKDDGRCRVCALGAMFLGAVVHGLCKMPEDQNYMSGKIEDGLLELWDVHQQDLIEENFEGWDAWNHDQDAAEGRWRMAFDNNTDRLIAILQNIIRNNGTFVPTDIRPIEVDSPTIPTLDFHRDLTADRALSPAETRGLVAD